MKYINLKYWWPKAEKIYRSAEARLIWLPDMMDYSEMRRERAEELGVRCNGSSPSVHALPSDYDSCDWRYHDKKGPHPRYWDFVCHSACHYLVDLHLYVATTVCPNSDWIIVSAPKHSAVWDQKNTLWDLNFLALGVPADEAFELANDGGDRLSGFLCR